MKRQSTHAAAQGDDRRARAVGFLMSLYQRRLASSTYAMRRSLENRAKRLADEPRAGRGLWHAPHRPPSLIGRSSRNWRTHERERLERLLDAVTLAGNAEDVRREDHRTCRALASKGRSPSKGSGSLKRS